MPVVRRLQWLLLVGLISLFWPTRLKAGLCNSKTWTLSEIADAPVLVVGRVLSLELEHGPHFVGNPRQSAPPQTITANVKVLRFHAPSAGPKTELPRNLKIRFLGRDGQDFNFCPVTLPSIQPGQVLMLPLDAQPSKFSEPWRLIGTEGSGMVTRVAERMDEPALSSSDPRSFLTRELVNSFRSRDPLARFTAASLVAWQADYLEPELTAQLQTSIGNDSDRWARILAMMLVSYAGRPLTLQEVQASRTNPPWPQFKGLPLAGIALHHLPDRKTAETMVWQSLLSELPRLADEPFYPLFIYNSSLALSPTIKYLSRFRDDPAFLQSLETALRKDRPGSSALAAALIAQGQRPACPRPCSGR